MSTGISLKHLTYSNCPFIVLFSVKGLFKVLYNICTPLTHTLTYSWSCGLNHSVSGDPQPKTY